MKTNAPGKNTGQPQIKTTTPAKDQPAQTGSNPHFRNDAPITGSEDTVQPITPETLPAPRSPLPAFRSPLSAPRLVALLLFFIALLPRLPGLGRFLTSDENTNIFFAGSDVIAAFLNGDFRGTYWHFYPGVTMSWLDAAGMAAQYWFDTLSGRTASPFTEYIYGDILSLVVATRLPYVILTAAAVPVFYLLARKLLPERMALFGALFLAFDPFYLAHSRVVHGDAPVAVFMSLSALTFFIYTERMRDNANRITLTTPEQMASQSVTNSPDDTKQPAVEQKNRLKFSLSSFIPHPSSFILYLALSALFGGLAALTKAPGQFMALFIIGLSALYAGLDLWSLVTSRLKTRTQASARSPLSALRSPLSALRSPLLASRIIIRWTTPVVMWGLISLLIFILLWPSMWVDPLGTFRQMWSETFGKVNEGHLVYFFGAATLDPGFWFYVYVIPFRLTPVVLIGSVISLVLLVTGNKGQRAEGRTVLLLWLFIVSLWLFGTLSPKKQDRYLLPLFPFLDLLAAIGWLGCVDLLVRRFRSKFTLISSPSPIPTLAVVLLLFIHFMPVVTYYPYYLTYFNPLMGGPTRAAETTLMGWGEGMEQAAAYLNTKPNAGSLYVASTPSQTLLPYFAGTGENFYTNDIAFRADYVVLYLAQMQRLAPSPDIVRYFEAQQPEKVIAIKGVPYAKIYPGPKLILPDIPSQAIPANLGLEDTIRLAGYKITPDSSSGAAQDGSPPAGLSLTLYWHALKPLPTDYTVSVRLRAADGRLLFQRDSWPVDGLLPTSQWRQGDYVADTHTLEIAGSELEQVNNFEIVVYNQETGETLGPPLTLPAVEAASQ